MKEARSVEAYRTLDVRDERLLIGKDVTRLRDADRTESDFVTGRRLRQEADVRADHGGDFGVSAGGAPVGQQNDRLTVAGHLNGAQGRRVRHDVSTGNVLDLRAFQTVAHTVRLMSDGIPRREEGGDAF